MMKSPFLERLHSPERPVIVFNVARHGLIVTGLGVLLGLATASFPIIAMAIPIESVPNPRWDYGGWVVDMANVLQGETEDQLNQKISQLEQANGSEIAVVIVPDTLPEKSPKIFATTLFNSWGIGKAQKNNGILFLISKRDRRVEIETGSALREVLPNTKVSQIISQQIIPSLKKGDFDQGTLMGTSALIKILQKKSVLSKPEENISSWLPHLLGFVGPIGIIATAFLYFKAKNNRPSFLKIGERSRVQRHQFSQDLSEKTPCCAQCRKAMLKVSSKEVQPFLSEIEQSAQHLRSVKFIGWQCATNCQGSALENIHVRAYIWNDKAYNFCQHCQELTIKRTVEVLEKATKHKKGKCWVEETCECCSYHQAREETISLLAASAGVLGVLDSNSHDEYFWGSSSSNYDEGSSDSGGGSSDFGGGSSDGGGSGGSW
jgi:uncharacterized protein